MILKLEEKNFKSSMFPSPLCPRCPWCPIYVDVGVQKCTKIQRGKSAFQHFTVLTCRPFLPSRFYSKIAVDPFTRGLVLGSDFFFIGLNNNLNLLKPKQMFLWKKLLPFLKN